MGVGSLHDLHHRQSPMIREPFGAPEALMGRVRRGHPTAYRPRVFDAADSVPLNDNPV